jgi:peptide/nickel transport system substrate-binding protein
MENRFGVKDFFIFLILIVLVVIVLLSMKQYDRQWDEIQKLRAQAGEEQKILTDLRDSVGKGVSFGTPGSQPSTPKPVSSAEDPFGRLRAAQAMPGYATGDWIVDAFPAGVAKLTPLLSGDAYANRVQGFVLESLANRDPDTLDMRPMLSTGWTVQDNTAAYDAYLAAHRKPDTTDEQLSANADCPSPVVITFTMRDGLRFSDGEPLTADDVVFSFDFAMNPKIADPREKSALKKIRKVEKVGTNQVRFYFLEPYFQSLDLAAGIAVLPKHFYGSMDPEEFNQSVGFLMGSGPYRMENPKTWKPGTPIQLFRNENYWGVRPAANRLVFREILNDVAYLTAFRNGDIDKFDAQADQYVRLLKEPALLSRTQHFEFLNPLGGYRFVAWNEVRDGKPTRFADKRVRQAMAMLVDKQQMMQVCSLGYAVEATGPFSPISKQCDPAIQEWPFDIERAKALLADAGFKSTNDRGFLVGPDGQPFSFKLTYPSGNASYDKMILFLKDSYAKAGIELVPDPLQWSVFTDRLQNKAFDTISLGWTAGIENDIYQMFDSANMVTGGDDFMSYKNPELDRAIEQARKSVDESVRMPLWRKAHAIIHEDQPYFFLWFRKELTFVDNRIQNVQLTKLGLNDKTEWFVPKDQQHWEK